MSDSQKRHDLEWLEAAMVYRKAKFYLEEAQQVERDAKAALIELTDVDAVGGGVEVKFTERRGSIDYKQVVNAIDPNFDAEPYRKESTSVQTVKVIKE